MLREREGYKADIRQTPASGTRSSTIYVRRGDLTTAKIPFLPYSFADINFVDINYLLYTNIKSII